MTRPPLINTAFLRKQERDLPDRGSSSSVIFVLCDEVDRLHAQRAELRAIASKCSYFLADGSMRLPTHVAIWMRELLAAMEVTNG